MQTPAPRTTADEEQMPHDALYKLLTDGSWTIVEFQNERGRWTDFPLRLLHLVRINERYFVLIFGTRSDDGTSTVWSDPFEDWSDSFLLDSTTGNMYYLNAIANLGGGDEAPVYNIEGSLGADALGRVYYLASPQSSNNFEREWMEVRERSGVVRLSVDEDSTSLTGEFMTSDANWVYSFGVTSSGDIVYEFGSDGTGPSGTAYRAADGSVGFLTDYVPWESWAFSIYPASDGNLYVVAREDFQDLSDPMHTINQLNLYELAFVNSQPQVSQVATLFEPSGMAWGAGLQTLAGDGYLLFIANESVARYSLEGTALRVDYPTAIAASRSILKSDRYVYILNGYDPANVDNDTTFAILVDLELETAIEYPVNRQRYQIIEFRDYPSAPDAVFAKLTDILTGTTASYTLHSDGTMEQLSEESEEALVITIEPL